MKDRVIDYDYKNDTLFVSMRGAHSSIEVDDYIIDMDGKNFICGLEILNASKNLHVPKKSLINITKAKFAIKYGTNMAKILLALHMEQSVNSLNVPLTIQTGHAGKEEAALISA
jgi:uncharacterized protein YuzE